MNQVYLVIGSVGEYSDHCMWHVGAYLDESLANEEAQRLNEFFTLAGGESRYFYLGDYNQQRDFFAWVQRHIDPGFNTCEMPEYGVVAVNLST